MYNLDFDTMKQVMQEHHKTGKLFSEVPAGIAGIPGPCQIEVTLETGMVVLCLIIGSDGRRLALQPPAKQLARLGRLQWTFTSQQESTESIAQPNPYPFAERSAVSSFPRHIVSLNSGQMRSWSRLQRMVFALADGTKSVERIAAVLSTTPELVEKTLSDLQAIGVVSRTPPP